MTIEIYPKALAADAVVLLLVLGYAFIVRKKGLVEFLLGIFKDILSVIITWFLYPYVGNFLDKQGLGEKLNAWLEKTAEWEPLQSASGDGLTGYLINGIEWKPFAGLADKENLLLSVISFIITFIAITIILVIIGFALRGIDDIPVICEINASLGFFLGLAVALLTVFIVLLVIKLLDLVNAVEFIREVLEKGVLLKTLYKYNPLLLFVR